MQAFVMKEGGKYRVFQGSGVGSARIFCEDGEPVDGGGFMSRIEAGRLARELNEGRRKREEAAEERES